MALATAVTTAGDIVVALGYIATYFFYYHAVEMLRRLTMWWFFARQSPWSQHLDERFLHSWNWACLYVSVSTMALVLFDGPYLTLFGFEPGLFLSIPLYVMVRLASRNFLPPTHEMRQHEIGPKLAEGFYRYLENALVDEQWPEILRKKYKKNRYTTILSLPPLIISCDLAAHYEHLSECPVALIRGLVDLENTRRRRSNSSEDVVNVVDELKYNYYDKTGSSRPSSFVVCTVKEKASTEYYVVCDNRPLFTLQKVFTEQDEVDVSELKRQQQNLDNHLRDLLERNESLTDKYLLVKVAGDECVSTALRRARNNYRKKSD